jgi:hypothetical protein
MAKKSIKERFLAYLEEHPEVLDLIVEQTRNFKERRKKPSSVRNIYLHVLSENPAAPPLNDHYCAHFARHIVQLHPELDGMFKTRRLRTK